MDTALGEWTERALCTQADPEIFFPPKGNPGTEAKQIYTSTSCDRRHTQSLSHTQSLTRILTSQLEKAWATSQTRRSTPIKRGVSDGIRTHDTQDHNLVL
jgi:hypothetical protein